MTRGVRCVAAALVVACGGGCTALAPGAGGALSAPNESLTGLWRIAFRLDSTRVPGVAPARWQREPLREVQGTLRLTDSTTRGDAVQSSIEIDFTLLLGRQMSCFEPRPRSTGVERQGDTVRFRFTPAVADCGFGASGVLRGDSLVGSWDETSFAGPVASGRFSMSRSTP